MRKITFFRDGIDRIISGRKKATTRLGEDEFNEGELLYLYDQNTNKHGTIRITKKEHRTFDKLDNKLAKVEGWPDLPSFKKKLAEIYGDLVERETLTIYFFVLETTEEK